MIEIKDLVYKYDGQLTGVFDSFSMSLSPGHIYGIMGPNGAGKSTLLYLMAGLLTPCGGRVRLDSIDVRRRLPRTMSEIFIVPDEYELPKVTLSDYIRTNSVFYPRFSADDMRHYLEVFRMTDDVNLGALSLGQGKKVFMSFAMATHTRVLLMDEPTNGLDIPGKEQFRRFLTEGRTPDSIFVVSTHQVKDIEQVLDHVVLIDRSRILADTDVEAIRHDGRIDLEAFFNQQINGKEDDR